MPRLQLITVSTRPGRVGPQVAAWAAEEARRHGGFDVETLDLAEIGLPFLDEPEHPSESKYVHQHTKDWSATISRGDAYVFVMPMYNGTYTAPLKNAIDFLHHEWQDKPVALLSYTAGPSGGVPAIEALRPILTRIGFRPAERSVSVPGIAELTGPDGFQAPEGLSGELADLLDELAKQLTEAEADAAARV
ncbi:NADPH-dependent FMN reductase [Streptomyces sp. NPDC101181]|uniref:NADPH-dependent FMN reductase n=1 Tax=Streptomyces sp. NPDC101181 TaxID=3366125 RepID=UPI003824F523